MTVQLLLLAVSNTNIPLLLLNTITRYIVLVQRLTHSNSNYLNAAYANTANLAQKIMKDLGIPAAVKELGLDPVEYSRQPEGKLCAIIQNMCANNKCFAKSASMLANGLIHRKR